MTAFVIDASIAIEWVVPENGTIRALDLLRRGTLVAPDLLLAKCANIPWKKVTRSETSANEAGIAARPLESAPVEILPTRHLLARATENAAALAHPAYDCLYLALAFERDVPLLSTDDRLIRKLERSDALSNVRAVTIEQAIALDVASGDVDPTN